MQYKCIENCSSMSPDSRRILSFVSKQCTVTCDAIQYNTVTCDAGNFHFKLYSPFLLDYWSVVRSSPMFCTCIGNGTEALFSIQWQFETGGLESCSKLSWTGTQDVGILIGGQMMMDGRNDGPLDIDPAFHNCGHFENVNGQWNYSYSYTQMMFFENGGGFVDQHWLLTKN